ncbi:MAG: DUF4157 domain-containing protein [Staphylococcus hominis]|nr:MAG: DUF4157 domain-containing protein [Staphylococcus hominis]
MSLADHLHAAANRLAETGRTEDARPLTPGEAKRVAAAFGEELPARALRFVPGPGRSAFAAMAFRKGNPAITVGRTVYIRADRYRPDLAATPEDIELLVHECTHVVQYRRHGFVRFFARYGVDLCRCGFSPRRLYEFASRDTVFGTETLEGQAQMAGVLAWARETGADRRDLERRMAGSRIFGL